MHRTPQNGAEKQGRDDLRSLSGKLTNIQMVNDGKLIGYVSPGRGCQVLHVGSLRGRGKGGTRPEDNERKPLDVTGLNMAVKIMNSIVSMFVKATNHTHLKTTASLLMSS